MFQTERFKGVAMLPRFSRLKMLARFGAVILAGVPTTLLFPLPVTCLFTRRFKREELVKRLHAMVGWARFCRSRLLEVDLQVHGRENLPRPSRGFMYVSNHQSYIDILVLMEALDTVAFLSKQLIRFIPVIGSCAYAGGTVFLKRKSKESRRQAMLETLRMCRESTAVVVFPEGTRSADGELRDQIQPGCIEGAWREGLRVVPIGLHGTYDVLPKAMDRVNLGRPAAVNIGAPLDPGDFQDAGAFVRAVWNAVHGLHARSRGQVARQRRGGPGSLAAAVVFPEEHYQRRQDQANRQRRPAA
jgi:1-acyl-sn-glycerol-3-phosphate acyltransferase